MPDGAWLYILKCADGSYYTGTARTTIEQRLAEHNSGHFDGYTATHRPVMLVYSQWFERITDAIAAERQVKGWSRAKYGSVDPRRFRRIEIAGKARVASLIRQNRLLMVRSAAEGCASRTMGKMHNRHHIGRPRPSRLAPRGASTSG
jgi:putative endonuclease